MAAWPGLDELKQRLDITSSDFDGTPESGAEDETGLSRLLAAAIAETKARIGDWDEPTDEPTDAQAQSALELAVERSLNEPPAKSRASQWLYGSRRRFGTA